MERKHFIKGLGLSLVTVATASSCTSSDTSTKSNENSGFKSGSIIHSVYFWLREGLSDQEKIDFLGFFDVLKKVPGLASCHVGKPAQTTPREVVDNSFDYHWLTAFGSMEDINTYEKHPDHLAAVEQYKQYWTKVEVKDSVL